MNILLVDNADSFTLNIAHRLFEVSGRMPVVVPNTTPYEDLPLDRADAVVLSPGPGRPSRRSDIGVCREVIERCGLPLLGVCLGHQAIAESFGARTVHAPEPVHGRVDLLRHTGTGLFEGLPQDLPVVRYHSLVSTELPDELACTAWTSDGLVMAVAHRARPVWGVQFHPESAASHGGRRLLARFLRLAATRRGSPPAPRARPRPSAAPPPALSSPALRPASLGPRPGGTPPSAVVRAFREAGGAARLRLDVQEVPWPGPPLEVFRARFAHLPHAFWLDSEGSDRPGSRWSFLGGGQGDGSVVLSYDLASRSLSLTGAGREHRVTGDVFDLLEQIVSSVAVEQADGPAPAPLGGGLVGFLGYELKALTTGDERHRSAGPDAWFLYTREFLALDHREGRAYVHRLTPPEDTAPGACPPGAAAPPARTAGAPRTAAGRRPGPVPAGLLGLRDEREAYLGLVERARAYIKDGESYEICLTTQARLAAPDDGLAAYARMRAASPVPYGAYLRCGGLEVLSSSPETFLRADEDGLVTSRPIKGTRPRGASSAEDEELRSDLLGSVKDRAENLMVVDLVRHDLTAVCEPGSVQVPEMFALESYSSVHQLVSTVSGRLRRGTSALAAVRSCFPAGSMTGAPKKRTMEIIDTLEGAPRGVYSGALGWLSFSGAADLAVVIRTAVLAPGGRATVGVGGAVTWLSQAAAEYEEVLVKARVPYAGLAGAASGVAPSGSMEGRAGFTAGAR